MEYILILLVVAVLILDISAIAVVMAEDIFYSNKQKLYKIIFIILIPIVGAILELYKNGNYTKYNDTTSLSDNYINSYSPHNCDLDSGSIN